MSMEITYNFSTFVDAVDPNYNEVYDLYQASKGDNEQCTFEVTKANHSEDTLIIFNNNIALRLTPKAEAFFPDWIEKNLMDGMDAESYWGMQHAMEKDEERERRGLD